MTPSPAIVELRQIVASKNVNELEKVIGLGQNEEVIDFIDEIVSNIDGVKNNDEDTEKVAKIGKPSVHEVLVRVTFIHFVYRVETLPSHCLSPGENI